MSTVLLTEFESIPELNFPITDKFVQNLQEYCAMFETKNQHSEALNSPLLGVVPIYFTSTDRNILFALCGVEESIIIDIINKVPGIEPTWVVAKDPYNHLIVWLAHRIYISNLSSKYIEIGLLSLFKLLHYKFFTSIVFNSYKYGADKATMESVIASLSNKYDIVKDKTWKNVIENRSRDVFVSTSIHLETLSKYMEDDDILYILSDIQSRIRQKIRLITELYYQSKERGDSLGSYSNIDTIDGEKIIVSSSNIFDTMIEGMLVQIQNSSRFIDNELIRVLCTKFQYINEEMFRSILTMLSEEASRQIQSGDFYKTKKNKQGELIYIGFGLIIKDLIQKTYRLCILDKINMSSKSSILIKTMNLYTSSRITNEDILIIKRSLSTFIIGCKKSSRDATNASLVIAVILYVIIRSFDYLN